MTSSGRKIVDKNVSTRPAKLSSDVSSKLQSIRMVNRYYNARQQHGNQWVEFRYFQDMLLCKFNEIQVTSEFSGSATSTIDVDLVDDTPTSKKLKLLADINTDQSTVSRSVDSAKSPDRHHNHQLLLEISTYLGPVKLTNEEKLSPLVFWKRYMDT